MKKTIEFLAILATFALCMCSCDVQPTNTADSMTSTGSADSGSRGNDVVTFDVSIPSNQYGLILLKAKTPDGKPAMFYVCYNTTGCDEGQDGTVTKPTWKFENVTSFEHVALAPNDNEKNQYVVYVLRQNYRFVTWFANVKADKANPKKPVEYTHEWTPGTFGLAPNGEYESADGMKKKTVKTIVKNGKVEISGITGGIDVPLSEYNKWFYEDEKEISQGTISDDLTKIEYTNKIKVTGKEFSGTVLRK